MSRRPSAPSGINVKAIAIIFAIAIVLFAFTWLVGVWWSAGIILGFLLLSGLLLLFVSRTKLGGRVAAKVWQPIGKTRVGKRIARRQLYAEANRRGVRTTDITGRPLSDFEIQLELTDTPEARAVKRQLRNTNPQQRAQMLRMLEAQAEQAAKTGIVPPQVKPPRPRYGKPR